MRLLESRSYRIPGNPVEGTNIARNSGAPTTLGVEIDRRKYQRPPTSKYNEDVMPHRSRGKRYNEGSATNREIL